MQLWGANMNYFDDVINDRKQNIFFIEIIIHLDFVRFQKLNIGESNYSYFPVIFIEKKDYWMQKKN